RLPVRFGRAQGRSLLLCYRLRRVDVSVQIHKHPKRLIEPALSATSFKLRTSWAQRRIPTGSRSRVRKRASAKCDRTLARDASFDNFGRFYFELSNLFS